jgi:NAD(P)H-hydrate repair Nnr-like enzyme with NAD(P)H-hydrate epimerase domain
MLSSMLFSVGHDSAPWVTADIVGFSFAPPIRKPFDTVLNAMKECGLPILSVDIPSGWHVEDGPQVGNLDFFLIDLP